MPPKKPNPKKKGAQLGTGAVPAMWNQSVDLEKEWLDKFRDDGACAVLCGVKASGKTMFSISFIRSAMEQHLYHTYWCVIPAYTYEQKNSYGWLDTLVRKTKVRCVVYSAFSDEVAEYIIDEQLRRPENRSLMFIDDASSMKRLFQRSGEVRDPLNAILTQSRHLRISSMICIHSLKSTIHPTIRMNCTFLVTFDIGSRKLLEHCHEEFASLICPDFEEFLSMFMYHLRSREHGAICFSTAREKHHDVDCLDWPIIAKSREQILVFIKANADKPAPRPAADSSSDSDE